MSNGVWAAVDYIKIWSHSFIQQAATPLLIVVSFWLLGIIFSRWIMPVLVKYSLRTTLRFDEQFLAAFTRPIRTLIFILGIYLALIYLPLSSAADQFLSRAFRSALIIIVAWGAHVMAGTESALAEEIRSKFKTDTILVPFFSKVVQFVVWAMALVLAANEWNYDVNGFIAGLGLGGLAFALAAKDALANIFGGIVIIMEKPFTIGDWVETPSVEGMVEGISFRSTRFRSFSQALVTVPNSTLANEPITNFSRMGKRRVKFMLSIDYSGPRDKIEHCIQAVKIMLADHPDVHPENILVHLENINVNSLDILVHFYTNTTKSNEYQAVKEDINYRIMDILAQFGVPLAAPGRVIYSPVPEPKTK